MTFNAYSKNNLSEQELIKEYFSKHQEAYGTVDVSIGDDAAIVSPPENTKLVITTDTLNVGVHFYQDCEAKFVGHKSLAVSLSDIAAMGANPLWATLSLSLPNINHEWLKGFSDGIYALADSYNLRIVGGDLVKGPLSITVQVIGCLDNNQHLLRSACQIDDLIYVSGTLGDAALGLALINNESNIDLNAEDRDYFLTRLHTPMPRLEVSMHVADYAHAAIDISDGFLIDLQRMLTQSHKAAEIELTHIPVSKAMQARIKDLKDIKNLLIGGEDYELIFTISPQDEAKLEQYINTKNTVISKVGKITKGSGISLVNQGVPTDIPT
ncbi:MAG: thiamine-phosphate kinase, partial [Gammaproteobacteria bacterium]